MSSTPGDTTAKRPRHAHHSRARMLARNAVSLGIALGIAVLVFAEVLLEQYTGNLLSNTEAKVVDLRFRLRGPREPSGQVVIVAIDSKSIEKLGRWPWSRTTHAALIDRLREWQASTVAFDVLFTEEEGAAEAARLRRLAGSLPVATTGEGATVAAAARKAIDEAIAEAEVDRSFGAALARTYDDDAALTVLAFDFVFEEDLGHMRHLGALLGPGEEQTILDIASYISRDENTAALRRQPPSLALGVRPVITDLAQWAAALGYANPVFDTDGALRRERLAVVYSPAVREAFQAGRNTAAALLDPAARVQAYMPLAVAAVATHLRLSVEKVLLDLPSGELRFAADPPGKELVHHFNPLDGTAVIDFYGPTDSFATYSFVDVLEGHLAAPDGGTIDGRDAFAGKLVFVGTTDHGLGDFFVTPFTARLPGVEKHANVAENLLAGAELRAHRDETLVVGLSALVAAVAVALLAGNLGTLWATVALGVLGGGWLAFTYSAFVHDGVIWNWTVPILTTLLSYAGVVGYRSAVERRAKRALAVRSKFIQDTFGRYLSDEVVSRLVESPDALRLGGERRKITIMMSDLRGFSSLCERSSPEVITGLLNQYLGAMTEIIFRYGGTIDEFIGDAILALFGAPVSRSDDAERAVACAIEMQLAMDAVNRSLHEQGFPEVEMGIALNTGEVIVGNIGSERRAKYGIVGTNVNLTGRIESLTVGGQVFMSENTLREAGVAIETGATHEVRAKGIAEPVTVYQVLGIGTPYDLHLDERATELALLDPPIAVDFSIIEGKEVTEMIHSGQMLRASLSAADLKCSQSLNTMLNLKISLRRPDGLPLGQDLYAKVINRPTDPGCYALAFTSAPPEVKEFLRSRIG